MNLQKPIFNNANYKEIPIDWKNINKTNNQYKLQNKHNITNPIYKNIQVGISYNIIMILLILYIKISNLG